MLSLAEDGAGEGAALAGGGPLTGTWMSAEKRGRSEVAAQRKKRGRSEVWLGHSPDFFWRGIFVRFCSVNTAYHNSSHFLV